MSLNILIVDDASFMRMIIKDLLTKEGYNVVGEADNGESAVVQFKTLKPDIVLMDITMPKMNGIEAVRAIKEVEKDAKIIICSALGQQSMILEAIHAGAKDFIVKPFEASRLIDAIKKIT